MKIVAKILKITGCILLALVLLVAVALGVFTAAEYRPAATETLIAGQDAEAVLEAGKLLTVVSWNCGYGALGDNADFFMDGGSSVYTADRERVESNLAGIRDKLSALAPDLMILQEVDVNSARSYGIDERTVLAKAAPDGAGEAFAYNFNALYIPYPVPPIGHVESGLFTLSAAQPLTAERISLPVPFSWPIRLVNLKRCLLVSRYPVKGSSTCTWKPMTAARARKPRPASSFPSCRRNTQRAITSLRAVISTSVSPTLTRALTLYMTACGSPAKSTPKRSAAILPC